MALSREDAWAKLCEWTETDSLRKHARAVEEVMRAAAHRYGDGQRVRSLVVGGVRRKSGRKPDAHRFRVDLGRRDDHA